MSITQEFYYLTFYCNILTVLIIQSVTTANGQFLSSYTLDDHLPVCGFTQYDSKRYFCCNERLHQRWDNDSCCGATPYNSTQQMCCNGALSPRWHGHQCCASNPYNTCHKLCCGGDSYDTRHYICCDGVARWRGNGFKCCGKQTYRNLNQLCCGGKVYTKQKYICSGGRAIRKEAKNHTKACGKTKTYNPDQHICCKDQQLVKRQSEYDECCGDLTFNTKIYQCCGERIYTKTQHDSCCKAEGLSIPFDSKRHLCCNGWLTRRSTGDEICCGTQGYIPNESTCCGTTVLSKIGSETGCCAKDGAHTAFDKGTHICCDGNLYPKTQYTSCCMGRDPSTLKPYHESHEVCCDGKVHSRTVFDKCCYSSSGVAPYNSSHHFCCDGTLHLGTASTHLCCKGAAVSKPQPNAAHPEYDCCGRYVYDTLTHLCCNNKIYNKSEYDACCVSADQPYQSSVSACCCDKIYPRDRFDGCCAGRGYNTRTHTCCWPAIHKKRKGYKCCGGSGSMFHLTTQRCCSGSVVTGRLCSALARAVHHVSTSVKRKRFPGVLLDFQ